MQPTGEWLNQPGGLAERLTRLRKGAGLTGDQLAAQLGWARSKIPKLENGRQMPSRDDVTVWARACGHPEVAAGLLEMVAEAEGVYRGWRLRLRGGHAAIQAEYDAIVRGAARIRNLEVMLIPGLLQTPGYARARALETVRFLGADPDGVDATVAARAQRQSVLYDTSKTFEFIITDAALRYLPCPRDVMTGQLDRLLGVLGLPNVTLGIIPPGRELKVTPLVGFLMADDRVFVETYTSEETPVGLEAARHSDIMDALLAEAETGEGARRQIMRAMAYLSR